MQRLLAMAAERWSVEEGGPLNPMTPPPVDLEYADLSGSEAGKTAGGAVSAPPAGTPNPSGSQARTGGASSGSGTGAAKAQKPSVSRTVKMGQVRQPTLVHRPMTSVRSGMQAGAAGSGATTFPEQQAAYPAVQMTYSSSVSSLARDLRQIVSMQSKTGAAAEAMAEKAAPESMQTINQMSQPLEQNQIVWQNPYMRGGPVSTDYRQKPAPARREQPQPQVRISEAEIRRTADRVFKMVQDKIVSERRRIGRY